MELILALCNIFSVPFTIILVVASFVAAIYYIVSVDTATDYRDERRAEGLAATYKSMWKTIPWLIVFLIITTLTYFPHGLVMARVQMIKLEITDEGVRHEVYDNIDRVFEKLEDKYLGSSAKKGKEQWKPFRRLRRHPGIHTPRCGTSATHQ